MSKAAVVTGGGSGIGRALVLELAGRGYYVAIADISEADAQESQYMVESAGGAASVVRCDVADPDSVAALVAEAGSAYPWPDLVFSNAGVALGKAATDYTRADLEWLFSVNVFGMWDVATAFARASIESDRPVRVVVTGSEHSLGFAHDGMAAYTASKHATLGFAEVMRSEWQEQPPSISILCPGLSQSRLYDGERHRTGAETEPDPIAQAVMNAGMPASEVARLAVNGAERGDFFVLTHAHVRAYANSRHSELTDALDQLEAAEPEHKTYEVMAVAGALMAQANEE